MGCGALPLPAAENGFGMVIAKTFRLWPSGRNQQVCACKYLLNMSVLASASACPPIAHPKRISMNLKRVSSVWIIMLACFILPETHGLGKASDQKLPIIDGKEAVATVNDEPISLEELDRAIASAHAARPVGEKAGRIDFSDIMQRLINTRLILLEAKNMGLDELPEIKDALNTYSKRALQELLLEGYVKDITADEDDVEQRYKSMVREFKLKSIRLKKEADARQIEAQLKAGRDFDEVLQKAVEWGIGEADSQGQYVKSKDLTLPVAQLVAQMKVGSTSPVLAIGKKGFVVFKLEDIRYPVDEDLEARQIARRQSLNQKRVEAARQYYNDLKIRYVKLDETLFDRLDYESEKPGFEKLASDKSVLARIKGEKPITVAELTAAIKAKFYHGVELAAENKRINSQKMDILENMLQNRLLLKEALKQGIDKTDAYRQRVKEQENSLIFNVFIQKVVEPDIKLNLKDLKTYHAQNAEKYTSPQLMRIKSLVFEKRSDAVAAIDKLKNGTDFSWLGSNAEGQVDPNAQGILNFDGQLVTQNSLPEKVQKAVSGANAGDFRLYESPQGQFYVLYIYQIVPARLQPFEEVRQEIAKKVFDEKLKKSVELWAAKLREYYPVKIYRTDLEK
jgi:PPIC-type PPIASE domain